MFGYRLRHRLRLPLMECKLPANLSLQRRELPHQSSQQICLAEVGCPADVGHVRIGQPHHLCYPFRKGNQPLRALQVIAQPAKEDDVFEQRHPFLKFRLSVLVPEELGVRKTSPQDTFVPLSNGLLLIGSAVGNRDKARLKSPFRVAHREVTLVLFHRGCQDIRRQDQELLVEGTLQRVRVFDQIGHLVEQLFIGEAGPMGLQLRLYLGADLRLALLNVNQDEGLTQRRHIPLERGVFERPSMSGQEWMAVRDTSCLHTVQAQLHDVFAEQREQPPDGPCKLEAAGRPAHGLREDNGPDGLLKGSRQHFERRLARRLLPGHNVRAFLGLPHNEVLDTDVLAAGEPESGLRGAALTVKRDPCRRPDDLFLQRRL